MKEIFIKNLYDVEKPFRFRPATEQELELYKLKLNRKKKLDKISKK